MAGLLDFEDPQQAGLLALAQGLFAAGAPQNRRVGLGEALAGGMGNMQQAQMQAEMFRRKKQEQDMAAQMHQMKFGQMQQEIEKQKAMEDAMVSFAKFKQGGSLPSSKIDGGEFYRAAEKHGLSTDNESLNRIVNLVNQGGHTPDSAAASLSGRNAPSSVQGFSMPTAQSQNDRVTGNYQPQSMPMQAPPQQAPQQQGFNKGDIVKSQIAELMQQAKFYSSRPDYQSQMLAQQAQAQAIKLANELPKFSNDFKVGRDKAGNLVNVRVADDGTETYSPTQVAEELHFGDNGQQLIASGKYSGRTQLISPKYQTPDSIASNATSMRGQNMTDARARDLNEITRLGQQTQVINDPNQGILLVDKGTGFTRKTFDQQGSAIPSEAQSKRTAAANNILPILDQAEKLLGTATNSYVGAGVDALSRGFGYAPEGAKSIAQLKILEGNLMMNQPRMEGPQSDKDVELYRQMAAQLGNPTVPTEIKQAALQQIRAIHQKYATGNQMQSNKSSGGWSIQKVN